MKIIQIILTIMSLLFVNLAMATVYQGVDGSGQAVFSDKPMTDSKAIGIDAGKIFESKSKQFRAENVVDMSGGDENNIEKNTEELLKKRGVFIEKIKRLEKEMEAAIEELNTAKAAGQPTEPYEKKIKSLKAELDVLIEDMQNSIDEMMTQQKKLMKRYENNLQEYDK